MFLELALTVALLGGPQTLTPEPDTATPVTAPQNNPNAPGDCINDAMNKYNGDITAKAPVEDFLADEVFFGQCVAMAVKADPIDAPDAFTGYVGQAYSTARAGLLYYTSGDYKAGQEYVAKALNFLDKMARPILDDCVSSNTNNCANDPSIMEMQANFDALDAFLKDLSTKMKTEKPL